MGVIKDAIRQIENRAKTDGPIAQYNRQAMLGLRDGTLHIQQNGRRGLTEATRVLAILANPDTTLETAAPGEEEGAEHTPNPVEIETVVDDNPEGAHANLGVISPQTNILVHVSHQNAGSVDTTTSTVNAAPKGEEEEGADDDRATTSASEAREITDFIRGALDSVADFQKQESRQLMETLGKTLVHGIRAMRTGAQPR